jgi:hypothetical protein
MGNYATITTTNNNSFSIFGRQQPTDNTEALNILVNAHFKISELTIVGTWNQKGIDLGASYGAYYENVRFDGLGTGLHLRFALNTMVVNCYATNCDKGFIADIGNWSGASNSNSQSNHTKFIGCRVFASPSSTLAFGVYGCSGVLIDGCIIEGKKVVNGIDFDGLNATVVKDFTVRGTHFECEQGASNAFVKIRMREGIANISTIFGQYPATLLDAGSQAGDVFVNLSNVVGWVANGSGKAINNAGGVNYILENNGSIFIRKSGIQSLFSGTAVNECTGSGCGLNKWYWKGLPSFQ